MLSEKIDISKLPKPSVEISVLDTSNHAQKLPLNVSDQISNDSKDLLATGVTSPASAKSCSVMSDQLQGRHSNMQDAECQTVLTGEFLEGLGSLEKFRDIGSQTVGTGDVISLNLFCDDLCNSDFKLPNSACNPLSDGLYNHITLKEIENHINVLQGNISHLLETVNCTVKVIDKDTQVNEVNIHCVHVNCAGFSYTAYCHKLYFSLFIVSEVQLLEPVSPFTVCFSAHAANCLHEFFVFSKN